jgi:uncharacterized membrane protein YfcA
MVDTTALLVLSIGVFVGALVSGFAGFAFSAVAGAMLLHVMPPAEAIPLMMMCSIAVQTTSLVVLRKSMNWQGSAIFLAGGALGIPLALGLLQHTGAQTFRVGFGAFLALYSTYMLFRPAVAYLRELGHWAGDAAVGFAGGLVGGLTAMPGALPTMWCDLQGIPKDAQRGLVQPFITVMQLFALGLMLWRHALPAQLLVDTAVSLPALAAGTAVGLALFGRISDAWFRRAILGVLLVAGLGLAI